MFTGVPFQGRELCSEEVACLLEGKGQQRVGVGDELGEGAQTGQWWWLMGSKRKETERPCGPRPWKGSGKTKGGKRAQISLAPGPGAAVQETSYSKTFPFTNTAENSILESSPDMWHEDSQVSKRREKSWIECSLTRAIFSELCLSFHPWRSICSGPSRLGMVFRSLGRLPFISTLNT